VRERQNGKAAAWRGATCCESREGDRHERPQAEGPELTSARHVTPAMHPAHQLLAMFVSAWHGPPVPPPALYLPHHACVVYTMPRNVCCSSHKNGEAWKRKRR